MNTEDILKEKGSLSAEEFSEIKEQNSEITISNLIKASTTYRSTWNIVSSYAISDPTPSGSYFAARIKEAYESRLKNGWRLSNTFLKDSSLFMFWVNPDFENN